MKVNIGGELTEVEDVHSIHDLLGRIGIDSEKKGIAIAKNGAIVPRKSWQEEYVSDGDAIEIVRASQGG